MTEERDYFACISIGGGGSWARGPDPEKAIKDCARIAVDDWSSLFDLAGKEAHIDLFDVTGHDRVTVDCAAVYGDNPDAKITKVETRKLTLPKKRRR